MFLSTQVHMSQNKSVDVDSGVLDGNIKKSRDVCMHYMYEWVCKKAHHHNCVSACLRVHHSH